MATQQLDIRPQQWFNQIFTLLVNNEIANPTYNPNYSSKFFFFKKRSWISNSLNLDWYDVLDYMDWHILTRKLNNNSYEVFDEQWNSELSISDWWYADKFLKTLWWAWDIYDSWAATGWSATTLQNTNKSRTDNELAWYYVYINDATWAWQTRYIVSNTSNTITVSWFDSQPADWSKYRIYTQLWDNISIPYTWWCYIHDWTDWKDYEVFKWFKIRDMVVWNSRLWYAAWNKVYYSEDWDEYYSPAWDELIISDTNINNLFPYWDYIITSTPWTIWLINKWFSTNDWTTFFTIKEWLSQIWVLNRFAITKYRDSLYLVWSDLRLYSVWVTINWSSTSFKMTDNWTLPSNFIKNNYNKNIRLYSDINYIYMYAIDWDITKEIYYNDIYKWWLNNEYECKVINRKLIKWKEKIMWNWFYWYRNWYKDLGETYWQIIKFIVWEPDIWLWKNLKYLNLLIWKSDYIQNWILTVTAHIWNKKIHKDYNLQNTWYISDIWDVVESTQWSNMSGTNETWWDTQYILDNISDIDILQIWTNLTWQILEVNLDTGDWDNWILFWWAMAYYNTMNPKLKYYKNII